LFLITNYDLVGTDGVADGTADAEDVRGVELIGIVLDVIVADFGAHKEMMPDVVANAGAKILHEMIAAGVIDATA
jgi:hypothetical protein